VPALQPRDLRKIDSRIPNLVPTILVRREAILVNILHIRALVKADAVLLFDTYGSTDSRLHSVFLYHLEVGVFVRCGVDVGVY
jgi:magnesium transporter